MNKKKNKFYKTNQGVMTGKEFSLLQSCWRNPKILREATEEEIKSYTQNEKEVHNENRG